MPCEAPSLVRMLEVLLEESVGTPKPLFVETNVAQISEKCNITN